ncbi:MAG: FAD:protein FMN transferase [Bacilli bacterium]|nr:FAD:protein FMN transferase [Bacilli bacterium]
MKKIFAITLLGLLLLTSCSNGYKIGEKVSYYAEPVLNKDGKPIELYNSSITLTTYSQRFLDEVSPLFQERVEDIHIASDRYNYYVDENKQIINNLRVVNESYGSDKAIKISDDLYYLLDLSLDLVELSEGYFNPTMGSLIDLWTDTIPTYPGYGKVDIVGSEEFNKAFNEMIPYTKEDSLRNYIVLNDEDKTVTFKKYKDVENIEISLGGIAKGYGMYEAEKMLKQYDMPMTIDGGSSSLALINDKPVDKLYNIGIASPYSNGPFGQKILYLTPLPAGTNISTSGDYLHYMYVTDKVCNEDDEVQCTRLKEDLGNGKFRYIRRHHILNPYKGHSENYYRVVNINANDRADVLDALTTALFNIDIVNDRDTFLRVIDNFEKAFNIEIDYLLEQEFSYYNVEGKEWSALDVYMNKGMNEKIDYSYDKGFDLINKEYIIE